MGTTRLEAFSDGVLAIVITIMVLELELPHEATLHGLQAAAGEILLYALSFVFVGIYWSNHHHLLQACDHVDGRILWANTHLLFWLSLIPFVTAWMGEHHFAPWPVALYGVVATCAGIAYFILARSLVRLHGDESTIARALGADRKGVLSVVIYAVAIPLAFVSVATSLAMYVTVSVIWLVPDTRVERTLTTSAGTRH